LRYLNYTQDFGGSMNGGTIKLWTAELLNLSDYQTVGLSNCRTIELSDYRTVEPPDPIMWF